jgi:dephospho-CoA kinase
MRLRRIQARDSVSEEVFHMRAKAQKEPPNPDFVVKNNDKKDVFYKALATLDL